MTSIRELDTADFGRLHELDMSEHITLVYRMRDGELVTEAHDWTRPRWDAEAWARQVAHWREDLKPDVWLGGFEGSRLAGLASLRYRLSGKMAQLTTLHVDASSRRRGVAGALLDEVIRRVSEHGATSLYVSATPSESAVGFYHSRGFRPAAEPDPRMYALEPEDIHMVLRLDPASP
jgi:ribosomal protein S18 acetylase RimI-like enzyme